MRTALTARDVAEVEWVFANLNKTNALSELSKATV
jgi:hypothetical protein